jgi:hypothetical protein
VDTELNNLHVKRINIEDLDFTLNRDSPRPKKRKRNFFDLRDAGRRPALSTSVSSTRPTIYLVSGVHAVTIRFGGDGN